MDKTDGSFCHFESFDEAQDGLREKSFSVFSLSVGERKLMKDFHGERRLRKSAIKNSRDSNQTFARRRSDRRRLPRATSAPAGCAFPAGATPEPKREA
jgi:hypothetical protein